jgi:hypothetical protein
MGEAGIELVNGGSGEAAPSSMSSAFAASPTPRRRRPPSPSTCRAGRSTQQAAAVGSALCRPRSSPNDVFQAARPTLRPWIDRRRLRELRRRRPTWRGFGA